MTGAGADAALSSGARCLVYALGSGSGHAVRGALLASALERRGVPSAAWVAAGRADLARALHPRVVACDRPATPAELRARLERLIGELGATRLVVDTFFEGIAGELASGLPRVHAVALLRLRRDAGRADLRALGRYARALDLEPQLGWRPAAMLAEPVGPVARRLERAPDGADVLLAAGDPELAPLFARLAGRLAAAGLRVEVAGRARGDSALLDAAALSARVVVGAAGYNLTYELLHLRSWHVALPRRRRFDDQQARAARYARVCDGPEALERVVMALARGGGRRAAEGAPAVLSHDDLAERVAPS
jgi:hypothetical protein